MKIKLLSDDADEALVENQRIPPTPNPILLKKGPMVFCNAFPGGIPSRLTSARSNSLQLNGTLFLISHVLPLIVTTPLLPKIRNALLACEANA